jgi:subtilase family serine protease
MKLKILLFSAGFTLAYLLVTGSASANQTLSGQVPDVIARFGLQPIGLAPPTNRLEVGIGLPLRNQSLLTNLLGQIYDKTSTNYHHYLTPEQFAGQFGPTAEDYQSVLLFAQSNHLEVTSTYPNRLLVNVSCQVADIEKAFHLTLHTYQHPTQNRTFYAPDTEPSVDLATPLLEIRGLNNFEEVHPASADVLAPLNASGATGSGTNGLFLGTDFRNAYAPGVTLDGSGQTVGLVEFDGYYRADIVTYETIAGRSTNIPVINVPVDGYNTNSIPGSANEEVACDIELILAMATNVASISVFQASSAGDTHYNDMLAVMVTNTQISQFSSSWGVDAPNPTGDQLLEELAVQGQSFFQASGDGDAFAPTNTIWWPAASPWVASAGGTELTMAGAGSNYVSETVWNEGLRTNLMPWHGNGKSGYWGSGGGYDTNYAIPAWQKSAVNTTNKGSAKWRNFPDVAMVADKVFFVYSNGDRGSFHGTSAAAPLWAAFTALANQQATAQSQPPVGFISPAIYDLARGSNYNLCFHDITTGSNTWSGSLTNYYAVTNYDLCTGFGSAGGSNLINALVGASYGSKASAPFFAVQPASGTTNVGATLTLSALFAGSGPVKAEWTRSGTALKSGGNIQINTSSNPYLNNSSTLTISNCAVTNSGNYSLTVTNASGKAVSSNAVVSIFVIPSPVLTITSPQNEAKLTNALMVAKGYVNYAPAISNIMYSLDGGPWLSTNLVDNESNWTAVVTLTPGTNQFSAFALDTSGAVSHTNKITVDYVVPAEMSVQIVGSGTVAPDYNSSNLDIGTTYSMKASAANGFAFYYWSDTLNMTDSPTLFFTMMSNLTATAYFKDITPPQISITFPTANEKYSNSVIVATGTASDNVAVTAVGARLNGGGWTSAEGLTDWSAQLQPVKAGTNTVQAYAMDGAGNLATNTVKFFAVIPPDWAPDDITNKIVQMTATNDQSVDVGFNALTFSQTDTNTSGDSGVGDYGYVKFATNGATLQLLFDAPPSITNENPTDFILLFTNANTGIYTNNETLDVGTFVITNATDLLPLTWFGHAYFATNTLDSTSFRIQIASGTRLVLTKPGGPNVGTYVATRSSPNSAMLIITNILTLDTYYLQLTFTSKTGGHFGMNTFGTAGRLLETESGPFRMN